MTKPVYHRQTRTLTSEQYQLMDGDTRLGYLDLHYGSTDVSATLVLDRELSEEDLALLIEQIDEDLVIPADMPRDRDDFLVRVFVGRELGLYSEELLQEDVPEVEDEFDGYAQA
jgi:hypothetical protein